MDTPTVKKNVTSKLLLIALTIIIIIGILGFIFGNTQNQTPPTPSPTQSSSQKPRAAIPTTPPDTQIAGQVVVKFKNTYTDAQIAEHLKIYDATVVKKIEGINFTVLKVPNGEENVIIKKMQTDPYIEKALPDFTNHTTYVPNDPDLSQQYGLRNTGQIIQGYPGVPNADINVEPAWDVTKGAGVKVAVLDSGIDLTHPELASKIIAQKQFSTSSIDNAIQDKNGHGTHVAGIIAATTNNAQGVAGTCPECQLIIGKVVTNDAQGNATGATSDIVSGITWAADQGAKVMNLSLRTTTAGSAPLYQQAIDYANSKGAVVVVAAGNDSSNAQVWPAANTGVVSVAATDNTDQMASFSNYGTFVRVAAPGVDILSTFPTTANAKNVNNYGYLSGTSMASPMVSGVVALIWTTQYGTSNTSVINRLYATADKIAGTGTNWTEGRINAGKAVGAIALSPTAIPTVIFPSPQCVGGAGQPPCATIAPTAGGNPVSPTITQRVTSVPAVTNEPGTTQVPAVTGGAEATATPTGTGGGTNPGGSTSPCPALDQLLLGLTSSADSAESHGHHHKHHRKSHSGNGGLISRLFEMLMKLLALLFQMIGIGDLCGGTTPTPTPVPGSTDTPTVTPEVTQELSPTEDPNTTAEPNPTSDPNATVSTTVEPTLGNASPTGPNVTTVPPVNGASR